MCFIKEVRINKSEDMYCTSLKPEMEIQGF